MVSMNIVVQMALLSHLSYLFSFEALIGINNATCTVIMRSEGLILDIAIVAGSLLLSR